MSPEYAKNEQFFDVFSFGVLVMEILSGQKNNCSKNGENVEDLLSCVSNDMNTKLDALLVDLKLII